MAITLLERRSVKSHAALGSLLVFAALGCRHASFPDVPAGYREFAYVSNGTSNTVSILDLVYLRQDRTVRVGNHPAGLAANPVRDEVYVVNTESGTVSVIDTIKNDVVATIPAGRQPYFISVANDGRRAFVANSGSNSISVIDLEHRRVIATAGTGERPRLAHISPDGWTLVVTNQGSGSVSIFDVAPELVGAQLKLRATFAGCAGAADAAILPDSSKAFVACSETHRVMALGLAMPRDSWAAKHDPSLLNDHFLTLLDVGATPVHVAVKPDGGEVFVSNYGSNSVSEISTPTNEVGATMMIGTNPMHALVSADDSTLYVANFGSDSIGIYSIDDGRLVGSIHTGSAPNLLAFSADEHLLLATDARSGDVSVIRTQGREGPALFTTMPLGGSPNGMVVKAMRGTE